MSGCQHREEFNQWVEQMLLGSQSTPASVAAVVNNVTDDVSCPAAQVVQAAAVAVAELSRLTADMEQYNTMKQQQQQQRQQRQRR